MKHTDLVQVIFLKSPTGTPWLLAYNKGDTGFVRRQKAEEMEAAGIIKPLQLPAYDIEPEEYEPAKVLEKRTEQKQDLTTVKGVKALLGSDIEDLRAFCDKHGIKYGKSAKRPEYFWTRIAKAHKQ